MYKNLVERGINELPHPSPKVRSRLHDVQKSTCPNGCMIMRDDKTGETVLRHNAALGCNKTKHVLEQEREKAYFAGRNYWLVPIKDRVSSVDIENLTMRSGLNMTNKHAKRMVKKFGEVEMAAKTSAKSIKKAIETVQEAPKPKPSGMDALVKAMKDKRSKE